MIKIQPKFKYNTVQYTDDFGIDKIVDFIVNNDYEIISYREDNNYITIYYKDVCYEIQKVNLQKGWFLWFDEMGLLNAAQPQYIKDNYIIYKE